MCVQHNLAQQRPTSAGARPKAVPIACTVAQCHFAQGMLHDSLPLARVTEGSQSMAPTCTPSCVHRSERAHDCASLQATAQSQGQLGGPWQAPLIVQRSPVRARKRKARPHQLPHRFFRVAVPHLRSCARSQRRCIRPSCGCWVGHHSGRAPPVQPACRARPACCAHGQAEYPCNSKASISAYVNKLNRTLLLADQAGPFVAPARLAH
jgi:hypothetical protein